MTTTSEPEPSSPGLGSAPDPFERNDCEDAYLEGDRTFEPGTARAAFSHRTFRIVYLGAFASNIGTWMQNVVLGALAYKLTHSGVYTTLIVGAQLGPLLVFSPIGGVIADTYDRRKSLLIIAVQQAVFSLLLAVVVVPAKPNTALLWIVVLLIGIGNALYAPIFSAVVPILVPRRDLAGAISLNSVQMNASRVIGPVIGATIYAATSPSWVFVLNALSFGFVIISILRVTLPPPEPTGTQGLHRLLEGLHVARHDRVVGQCLITIFTFSFLCLPFIPIMPVIANDNLGLDVESTSYGVLYACFGLGAVIGALSIGTVFSAAQKARLTRIGLVLFAVMLLVFGNMHVAVPAFAAIMLLGCVYFMVITSLSTVLQEQLDNSVRGKVMALWIMGFGGTVPFGGIAGALVVDALGIPAMVGIGAAFAVFLAWWADLRPVRPKGLLGMQSGSADADPVAA